MRNPSCFANADFTDAQIIGAALEQDEPNQSLTVAQLCSTASYKAKDLHGTKLDRNDLSDCNLAHQNLTKASFNGARLTNADFTDVQISEADFTGGRSGGTGLTAAQLYSTANYKPRISRRPPSDAPRPSASSWTMKAGDRLSALQPASL